MMMASSWTLTVTVLALCAASALANINWNGNNWALACGWRGNDLSNANTRSDLCIKKCASTYGCSHFSWTNNNGGTCWMKQGKVCKSDAVYTGDQKTYCGVVTESNLCGGGRVNGFTTRYWDCCEPSCASPGKLPWANKYVRSCLKNGQYTAPDWAIGKSACGAGQVFACSNHSPWAVNDQLAYGFAAATIPGLDESGRCCRCYKLEFTSGRVEGKTMIVQVTNRGSDAHPNQFDLQVPGGGVGNVGKGCDAQWNVGPSGWGKRTGGVSSRSDCSQLPEQLRQGCFWRFDWFRSAENPSMVYSRVRCPDELVARSNCRREDE